MTVTGKRSLYIYLYLRAFKLFHVIFLIFLSRTREWLAGHTVKVNTLHNIKNACMLLLAMLFLCPGLLQTNTNWSCLTYLIYKWNRPLLWLQLSSPVKAHIWQRRNDTEVGKGTLQLPCCFILVMKSYIDEYLLNVFKFHLIAVRSIIRIKLHRMFTESQCGWGWKDLEVHLAQPLLKQSYQRRILTLMCRQLLKIPKETLQHRNAFWCSETASCAPVCVHCLCSWQWTPEKSLFPFYVHLPFRCL